MGRLDVRDRAIERSGSVTFAEPAGHGITAQSKLRLCLAIPFDLGDTGRKGKDHPCERPLGRIRPKTGANRLLDGVLRSVRIGRTGVEFGGGTL